ncbi:hypothetical protein N7537_005844 [Penicillium hordei]|uniref:Uncharacterized protein n=1 Tax=Penicillium hordei TaxID=40994 RepID=A0AAD6H2J0_9EURO|nr:uncharacterized protein N7537_005844 [Penicillium hordei]KAJ5602888.1 hypothetical protein N7537_005844 [Penicillium hordei]
MSHCDDVELLELDITDSQHVVNDKVSKAIAMFGQIDILGNNAGYVLSANSKQLIGLKTSGVSGARICDRPSCGIVGGVSWRPGYLSCLQTAVAGPARSPVLDPLPLL